MDTTTIKNNLKQAEALVIDIKDEVLKVKAFELAYKEISGHFESIQKDKTPEKSTNNEIVQVRSTSIVEYCKQFLINNELDRVLIMGAYLEKENNQLFFLAKDIQDCYFKAKEKQPQNIHDKISKNIAKGFIMDSQEKAQTGKTYVLTRTGDEHVQELKLKNENK